VCAVETAEEGYELICRLQPDVVITDLRLPGMSGQELLVRVKRNYPDVEIIMITAHGGEVDAEEARANGAADYLSKPLDLIDLGRSVERCLHVRTAFAGESDAGIGRFTAPERQPT
jgi:DNA-binding NtrC family response regulator